MTVPFFIHVPADCLFDLRLARCSSAARRGVVLSFTPGWRTVALPLTADNDDDTPVDTTVPGTHLDAAPPAAALTLYRLLWSDGSPVHNGLTLGRGGDRDKLLILADPRSRVHEKAAQEPLARDSIPLRGVRLTEIRPGET